jgi:hypothetical protein
MTSEGEFSARRARELFPTFAVDPCEFLNISSQRSEARLSLGITDSTRQQQQKLEGPP